MYSYNETREYHWWKFEQKISKKQHYVSINLMLPIQTQSNASENIRQ